MVAMVLLTIIMVSPQVQAQGSLPWAMGPSAQMVCLEAPGCSAAVAGIPLAMVCTIYGDVLQCFRMDLPWPHLLCYFCAFLLVQLCSIAGLGNNWARSDSHSLAALVM